MNVTVAGVFALCMLVSTGANACRCIGPVTPSAAYAGADQVLLGKALEVHGDFYGRGGAQIRFGVLMAWKGDVEETVQIESSTTCAFPLQAGTHYLLYLNNRNNEAGGNSLSARSCMGSTAASDAGESLEWLRLNSNLSAVPPR